MLIIAENTAPIPMAQGTIDTDEIVSKVNQLLESRYKSRTPTERHDRLLEIYTVAYQLTAVLKAYSKQKFTPKQALKVKKTLRQFPTYLSGLHVLAEEVLKDIQEDKT